MKIEAIVYTSLSGHTKEYAKLLSEELFVPYYELSKAKEFLAANNPVIYLGCVNAGTIRGYRKAKAMYSIKALGAVGMVAVDKETDNIRKVNKISDTDNLFTLEGGIEFNKLTGLYKFAMNLMRKGIIKDLAKKQNRTAEEELTFSLMTNPRSLVKKENMITLINYVKEEN